MPNSKNDKDAELKSLKQQLDEALRVINQKEAKLHSYQQEIQLLNQRIELAIGKVSKELEYAKALHRSLIPTEKPQIPGFEFSTKFVYGNQSGGDYFDLFEMKSKLKFGILLISCGSFTLSSLVISIVMKMTMMQHKLEQSTAAEFVQALKKEILEQAPDAEAFDILFALVDRRDYSLSLSAIGEVYTFLQRADKDAIEVFTGERSLSKGNPEIRYLLNSKDRVVLCTKGLVKEMQPEAIDRSVHAIRSAPRRGVHDLRNEILIQREMWTKRAQPDCDVTLVVMEVKDRVIKLAKS